MLRPYRRSDLDRMVALDMLCFEPEFQFDARSMRRFAEGRWAHTIVAERVPGELDGFVVVELAGRDNARFGYCVTLDVAPAERGCGLGERLLRAAEGWAAAEGAASMALHVWVKNEVAIRFYERLGYVLEGAVPGFYGAEGMDALVYRRQLVA